MAELLKENFLDSDDITDIKENGKEHDEKQTLLVFSLFFLKYS